MFLYIGYSSWTPIINLVWFLEDATLGAITGGGASRYADFGGIAEGKGTFGGYTIPTHLRIGWYFGGRLVRNRKGIL